MKEFQYITRGTCSRLITVTMDENHIIHKCSFFGGCDGNLQGISRLICGQRAEDVIERLEGISCNGKPTSCPDQLAHALRNFIAEM